MRLLDPDLFAPAFAPLSGKHVAYVALPGNWGDRLIDRGAFEMMDHFGVKVVPVDRTYMQDYGMAGIDVRIEKTPQPIYPTQSPVVHGFRPDLSDVEVIVVAGGGSMGTRYRETGAIRAHLLTLGKPVVILPSTFTDTDPTTGYYQHVYVRERGSLAYHPSGTLVPDLALAVEHTKAGPPVNSGGVFLRHDGEANFGSLPCAADPHGRQSLPAYLAMAERQAYIVTDCLHFAIAGLYYQRPVTLLPGAIHKNRSMWEAWLRDLRVQWRERV